MIRLGESRMSSDILRLSSASPFDRGRSRQNLAQQSCPTVSRIQIPTFGIEPGCEIVQTRSDVTEFFPVAKKLVETRADDAAHFRFTRSDIDNRPHPLHLVARRRNLIATW